MSELLGRLGLSGARRAVVVSLDELGFSLSANQAIYAGLREGAATSATLLVPAPWARAAAASYRGEDVGVHLTLNAEHDLYRWGPLTQAPSLLDGDGGFPRTVDDVWDHADLDEVRREWRAQVERAIYWGFDVSHLGAHLGAVALKPEFFDVYLDLADEFRLPLRLPALDQEGAVGFPFRRLAAERSVCSPERMIPLEGRSLSADGLLELLEELPEGVSELQLRPALDSPELRAATPGDWQERVEGATLVAPGGLLGAALDRSGIPTLGYRALRSLMRRG